MASLMKIAQEQAENLRESIAWVIVWRTDQNWHAETIALDRKTRTWGSAEDKKRACEILKADPQAVILNGDDCYCPGKKSVTEELAKEIRENYEDCVHPLRYVLKILTVPETETAMEKHMVTPDK